MNDLLCEYRRGGRVESVHRGAVAVVADGRVIYRKGDVAEPVFLRSCAKPFQAFVVVESGAADACGLTAEELAVVCGSHGGEPDHVRAVTSILRKAGVAPAALCCGVHAPSSPKGAAALVRSRREPGAIHNNCSGKHSGMLAAARSLGAKLETYLDPSHPVQRANLATVSRLTGIASRKIPLGTDGCSAPTFAVPVRAMARAIAAFSTEAGTAARIRGAMMSHPYMVGRPCVQLMCCAPGRLVGKGGAEGVYLCGLPGRGAGIALKIADGSLRPAMHLIVALCRKLRLLGKEDLARLGRLADPVLRNHAGIAVGEVRARL